MRTPTWSLDENPIRTAVLVVLLAAFADGAAAAAPNVPTSSAAATSPAPLLVTPDDRVLLQRGFVPVDGTLRLYACVVGTPAGLHYAYDFETGALLSVWGGPFADLVEIWGPRARNQTARPAGSEIAVMRKPLLAQFPDRPMFTFPQAWPGQPAALYSYRGYELEPDGQPVFRAQFEDLALRDRIAPAPGGRGLTRRLEFSGGLPAWETWVLLAEAGTITAAAGGREWSAGEGRWRVEWPADSPHGPVLRSEEHGQLLVLRLEPKTYREPVVYTLSW